MIGHVIVLTCGAANLRGSKSKSGVIWLRPFGKSVTRETTMGNSRKLLIRTTDLTAVALFIYGLAELLPELKAFNWCDQSNWDASLGSVVCGPPGLSFYWDWLTAHPSAGVALLFALAATWRRGHRAQFGAR